ncbi:MAG: hypothetical protein B7Z08_12770 [Sphingomonadales bacterium 32-68-7]|nr:MAG: hypothetical protein B7Z33_00015 [Sphingomonadales bacterium 12-68-11]OYX07222.1 MAG: hypothetical protein B7Z08_12770 [Sphingomonadales bacterium 32-68-7]
MTWHVLAAGLAVATGLTPAALPDVSPPHVEVHQVLSEPYRRMTVPVTINGMGPYRFLVDTGAQSTVLSRDLADRLALMDRRSAILVGMASRRSVETTLVQGVELGSRSFNIPTAPLVEQAHIGGADGVLGLDTLQDQRVLLDFRNRSVTVVGDSPRANRGYDIVVRAQRKLGQLIITRARIDGVAVAVVIDTGAQGSTGNPKLLARMSRSRPLADGTMIDINGVALTGAVRMAKSLTVDRVELQNLPVLFADSPTFHALGLQDEPALILGMEHLRMFERIAIDFRTQRVLFDVPSPAPNGLESLLTRP